MLSSDAFSQRLRDVLQHKHMTRNQAAASLGIPGPQLSRYLNGQLPDLRMLVRLAQWSGHTMDWLLLGQPESTTSSRELPEMVEAMFNAHTAHVQAIEDLCKNLDVPALVTIQRLLRALQPSDARRTLALTSLEIAADLADLDTAELPLHTKARRAAKLFKSTQKVCLEQLPLSEIEMLWNAVGQELYLRSEKRKEQDYVAFAASIAKRDTEASRSKTERATRHIHMLLKKLRRHYATLSDTLEALIKIGEEFPHSPLMISRSNWRKSSAFRDQLLKLVAEASANEVKTPEAWESYCKKVRTQLLGE